MTRFRPAILLLALALLGVGLLGLAFLGPSNSKGSSTEPAARPAQVPTRPEIADCSAQFPQLPLGEIPPPARLEFCRFAQDTFCYCGCPHMVAGCLKDHATCPHATRMSAIALGEIASGASAEKAGEVVAAYYDSFKPEKRVQFDTAHMPCRGDPKAKLTLVEFSDFDCPHCKAARPMLEKLVKERTDTRLCFMSFPLHAHSTISAAAAAYADSKGSFWKMHDLLFENQDARFTMDEATYTSAVENLGVKAGLDKEGLDKAIHDLAVLDTLQKQKDLAHKLGVDGTPFVFLNGRPLPAFSPELLKLTISDEEEYSSNGNAWAKD